MNETTDHTLSRRSWVKIAAGTVAGGSILATASEANSSAPKETKDGIIVALGDRNVVETTAGKVRGYTRNGVSTFKGIPYAGSTAGQARFQAPAAPLPWTGIRSSLYYGPVAPQGPRGGWAVDENAFMFEWDDGQPGEDCLRVNIWTPGVNDNRKRPVMVWLHGGGFSAGSGQELKSYDGENLARHGDVVVVSLNHRLNVLGYLNLSEIGGEKYASSANVGNLDLIAALKWVRDNIGNFGGDPNTVLIFGQSGGGGKVGSLMAMPAAKGLFHRAAVQSGSMLRANEPEDSGKLAAAVMTELDLTKNQLDELHNVPVDRLIAAASAALKKISPPVTGPPDFRHLARRMGWGPTVDGHDLPRHPFDPTAPEISASVPMLIGSVQNEFVNGIGNPHYFDMTAVEMKARITAMYGERAKVVLDAYQSANPNARPAEIVSLISAASVRNNAVVQAGRKADQKAAVAYVYWFTWKTPILDGRPGAFHCAELPFVFDNTDRCAAMTGGGAEARALGQKVSQAWIAFARSGNPNHSGLPDWPAFQKDKAPTMILDERCQLKNDPDGPERRLAIET